MILKYVFAEGRKTKSMCGSPAPRVGKNKNGEIEKLNMEWPKQDEGSGHHGEGYGHHGEGSGHDGEGHGHHGEGSRYHGEGSGHHNEGSGHNLEWFGHDSEGSDETTKISSIEATESVENITTTATSTLQLVN